MNVQELFKSVNVDEFVHEYMNYDCHFRNILEDDEMDADTRKSLISSGKKMILSSFENMKNMDISNYKNEEKNIVFVLPSYDEGMELDTFLVEQKDLEEFNKDENFRVETYGYEFCDTNKILSFIVSETSRFMIDNDAKVAASIFYEVTFFGYDECEKAEKLEETKNEINAALEEVKEDVNNSEKFIPPDKVFENLGYVDKRYDFEKTFETEVLKLEMEFSQKRRNLIFKQENKYIINEKSFSGKCEFK